MRVKGIRFEQVVLAALLVAALCWNLANASEIKQLRIDTGATGTRAELLLDREGAYKLIDLRNPDRLVVDFPASRLRRGLSLPKATGVVKAVRSGQPEPGTVRIVFDLAGSVAVLKPRIEQSAEGPRLVLEWPGDGEAASAAAVAAALPSATDPIADIAKAAADVPAAPAQTQVATTTIATGVPTRIATGKPEPVPASPQVEEPIPAPRRPMQPGMRPLVIAIDAGHVGQDPGAIGPNCNREKNVTLAIARELARQVNAKPGMKAYLTRDTDVFIPLNRRAVLARGAKADIFVSIHADAAENREATGSSVYVLSTRGASSQRARWLADKENAADLIGGVNLGVKDDHLARTLLDLSQTASINDSLKVGKAVLGELGTINKLHKGQVEQASFAVLKAPDIPSILVETAFISNPEEEARLNDEAYQDHMAEAIMRGLKRYFAKNPPMAKSKLARLD